MPKQACRDPEQLEKNGEARAPLTKTSDKECAESDPPLRLPASDKPDVLQEFFSLTRV
jgi:hypothetical protein